MAKEASVAAKMAYFKGEVNLTVVNAANSVTAQIESLQAIVAKHPNAILVDASSLTALNPVISRRVRCRNSRRQLRPASQRAVCISNLYQLCFWRAAER